MSLPIIKTAFGIVTEESSMEGDAAEHGWIDEAGHDCAVPDDNDEDTVVDIAVRFLRDNGACHASSSHFHPGMWYSTEAEQDMYDGSYETRSFHLSGFTDEQEREIAYRMSSTTHCLV